ELAWTHRTEWRYELDFHADAPSPGERVDLVLDGLDTVTTIALNGRELGDTANMHRSYRFDVRHALEQGTNTLVVSFRSALEYAEEQQEALGARPHVNTHPYNAIRKMACSFGWDWGPDLQTAGIWRPVRLERWRTARLSQVRPLVTVDPDGTGRVEVHADIEHADTTSQVSTTSLKAEVACLHLTVDVPFGATTATAVVEVPDAPLWWPVGYVDQPLHDLTVTLVDGDEELDTYELRIGFRT